MTEPAESGFDFSDLDDDIVVEFTVDIHRNPDGTSPTFRHRMRLPASTEQLDADLAKLSHATSGLTGPERRQANRRAVVALWASLVVDVEGYASDVNALRGHDLVEFFSGKRLPADAPEEKRERAVSAMFAHVDAALSGYLRRTQPRASFR